MNSEQVLNKLLEEMRSKGSLPALNETVLEISRLAKKQDASAPDLAAVIMRDCGLASSLLATVNSAYYAPRLPVKTISATVTYLGFDKVFLIALGLGLLRHTMASLQKRQLLKLYATSYFSGILAMALANTCRLNNPEEIFIAGLLYRLPGMSLAHTFPQRFQEMEKRVNDQGLTMNQACTEVFEVGYDDICDAVFSLYHLPKEVEQFIGRRTHTDDPSVLMVEETADLAAMLFGDREGGKKALHSAEKRIRNRLELPDFSISAFIRQTFETDGNVKPFFNLSAEDVEMMVNLLEWGKANPMQVVTHMDFGSGLDNTEPADAPEVMIGHFLTEMALCRKRGESINQLLMLAQEALFRCFPNGEIILAFLTSDKQQLQGRFYAGNSLHIDAQDFCVPVNRSESAIIHCLQSLASVHWQAGASGLGLPYHPFGQMHFRHAYLSPIVVHSKAIGLCFAGRLQENAFSERECVWIDQIVDHIAAAFRTTRD